MIVLAMVLLAIRDDRLGLAELVEHDHELAALDLLHLAREKIADARRELVADPRALALANALDDALLRGLHGGATELGEVDRLFDDVADFEAFIEDLRVFHGDLAARVLDLGHDGLEQHA